MRYKIGDLVRIREDLANYCILWLVEREYENQ